MDLRLCAQQALCLPDPQAKAAAVRALWSEHATLSIAPGTLESCAGLPGRPARPLLVHPARVPHRAPGKPEGLAALLHAIAHIEFNAINLALDAVWRFAGMPREFYIDWLRVAKEESEHFALLDRQLQQLGFHYGDFEAHDNLWAMCERTQDSIIARMALVPRTMEARGLDATPMIQAKLRGVGTPAAVNTVAILDIILRDEIGHVAIGNHWYRWLCARDGLDPLSHYSLLAQQYQAPKLFPPFNEAARRQAGFSVEEMEWLMAG